MPPLYNKWLDTWHYIVPNNNRVPNNTQILSKMTIYCDTVSECNKLARIRVKEEDVPYSE